MPIFNERELFILWYMMGYLSDDPIIKKQIIAKLPQLRLQPIGEYDMNALKIKLGHMLAEERKRNT